MKMPKLRVFEAFSGYGSQHLALKNIGVDCEIVAISDIDKSAIIAYDAIHNPQVEDELIETPSSQEIIEELSKKNIGLDLKSGKIKLPKNKSLLKRLYLADKRSKNLGDISLIEPNQIPDHDLFTYSFPCQDISALGEGKGFSEGEKTRSGLLWECRKVIEAKRPKFLLLENVKNIVSKKHMPNFILWCQWLESMGYKNNWKVLNARDFDVPQNRERCFLVSVLQGESDSSYSFPDSIQPTRKLRDLLEDNPPEKSWLRYMKQFWIKNSFNMEKAGNGFKFEPHIANNAEIAKCVLTRAGHRMDDNYIMYLDYDRPRFLFSPKNPCILEYDEGKVVMSIDDGVTKLRNEDIPIRKITVKECLRLMGVDENSIDKMVSSGISEAELYKLAGNSIVVNVLENIFKKMFLDELKPQIHDVQNIQ